MREQGTGGHEAVAARVHRKIITRHAEDAAFYWARRMEGSLTPQHDLRSLGRFEFLLQANLEGLRVAQHESSRFGQRGEVLQPGSAGWDASLRRVKLWKTADETFVAAVLAIEDAGASGPLLGALEEMACDQFDDLRGVAVPPMARGLASAAAWLPWEAASPAVLAWARSLEPVLRRAAVSALALHRLQHSEALGQWLQDPHSMVRARALRAAGELGRQDLAPALVAELVAHPSFVTTAGDPFDCRTAAAEALCLLNHGRGIDEVGAGLSHLETRPLPLGLLAAWAQVAHADALQAAIHAALQQREHWRTALHLIRFSGQLRWVDVLIQMMEHQVTAEPVARFFLEPASNLARHAADVFAHLTGARIGDQLWCHAPEPDDSAEDAASDPRIPASRKQDPDDGLLWPDVDAVKRWWHAQHDHLGGDAPGRHLAGMQLVRDGALRVLASPTATQAQRHHAALHLRCSGASAQLFDVKASLPQQRAQAAVLGVVLS